MTVKNCSLLRENRTASFGIDNDHKYTKRYRIHTTDANECPLMIFVGAQTATPDPLPKKFDIYIQAGVPDAAARCLEVSLESIGEDAKTWYATAIFGKLPPGKEPEEQDNPLLRPVRYRIEYQEETAIVVRDIFGNPIANTIGDEFDEPLEQEEVYPTLVAEKNYATLQQIITIGNEYHRSVNNAIYYGAAARTVRFLPVTCSDLQTENDISFYTATFRFMFNPNTWDRVIMNRGWRYRPAAGANPIAAIDPETRLPLQSPPKLAADGTLLPAGTAPHWLTFQLRPLKNFALIGV